MELPQYKALGQAVRISAANEEITERRLRRWLAVTAFFEILRLGQGAGNIPEFVVKGGFAIELRFQSSARSSRDVDIVLSIDPGQMIDPLIQILRDEWSGFSFEIKGEPEQRERSLRLVIRTSYRGKDWSTFDVDLVSGDTSRPDQVAPYDTEKFGLVASTDVPCLNVFEQIAQKLHAATNAQEDRARDLLDIYLLDTRLDRDDAELLKAVERTFAERGRHAWPSPLEIRPTWRDELVNIIEANKLELAFDEIIDGVNDLVVRLIGVQTRMNFRYRFLVLSAHEGLPSVLEGAFVEDEAYATFGRMTSQEGWRLVQLLPYPSRDRNRAVLAILEQPVAGGE